MIGPKPWFSARWETLEPEPPEDYASEQEDYNDPTDCELLDYEERYELYQ
ncbi:hypothetical protein KNT87_gp068 [Erwinia phage Cronus]|uniref:Uncharacterized protein n=1 Tax=Erwinia phage Cronus TaxID=2163633 RepID=A0A2S1GM88_9CAUD|nr:hypothetical protein KNT87_gp068 [Erwinia phage Cronus]AWD90507.1 hypothetical protein [Erwinia phage Cronus]